MLQGTAHGEHGEQYIKIRICRLKGGRFNDILTGYIYACLFDLPDKPEKGRHGRVFERKELKK